MKLGLGSLALLAVTGGAVAWLRPGLQGGALSPGGRAVFEAVGVSILDGSLPESRVDRARAVDGLLERIDVLIGGLPEHARSELSQLLSLLSSTAGRVALMGLATDWPQATVDQVQIGLQRMRTSRLPLQRQAYHALHDIVGGAYFSDAGTWRMLGYPGPRSL